MIKQVQALWSCDCVLGDVRLTHREVEIVVCIASGLSNVEIASRLSISVRTVESHLSNLLGKASCRARSDLMVRCFAAGVLMPGYMPPRWSGKMCLCIPVSKISGSTDMLG